TDQGIRPTTHRNLLRNDPRGSALCCPKRHGDHDVIQPRGHGSTLLEPGAPSTLAHDRRTDTPCKRDKGWTIANWYRSDSLFWKSIYRPSALSDGVFSDP